MDIDYKRSPILRKHPEAAVLRLAGRYERAYESFKDMLGGISPLEYAEHANNHRLTSYIHSRMEGYSPVKSIDLALQQPRRELTDEERNAIEAHQAYHERMHWPSSLI